MHLPWQRFDPCFRRSILRHEHPATNQETVLEGEGIMNGRKRLLAVLLACAFFSFACVYVVLPEGLEAPDASLDLTPNIWSAFVTKVDTSEAGDLHVDITIRNDTGDWST